MFRGIVVLLIGLIVSGCVSNESRFFSSAVTDQKGSAPGLRTVGECMRDGSRGLSRNQQEDLAALMMVSVEQVPEVLCRRVLTALANGRLTRDEAKAAAMNRPSTNLIRILQAR